MRAAERFRALIFKTLLRTPTTMLAAILAGSVVGLTWFSTSLYLATGDVAPMRRESVLETVRNLWNHQNTGGGGISYEVARLWEQLFAEVGDGIPWSGPSMGQRLFYVFVFGYAAWGLCRLTSRYISREWVSVFAALAGVFSPYVAMQAPTPVPLLAIGMVSAVLSEYINIWRGQGRTAFWWCVALLPASYACINPPLLVLVAVVAIIGVPLTLIIERPSKETFKRSVLPLALRAGAVVASTAWWSIPFLLTISYANRTGTLKAVTDVSSWSWTHRNSSLANVLSQTANWGAPDPFYIGGASSYFHWPLRAVVFVAPVILVCSLFLTRGKRRRVSVALTCVYAISAVISQGLHEPFGALNEFLYGNIPGFFLFREPFSKFGVLLAVAGALGLGLGIEEMVERGGRRIVRGSYSLTILTALVAGATVAATHPVWLGTVMDRTTPTEISIPRNWGKAAKVINSSEMQGRTLVVPFADFYQMPTVWGYYGIDSLPRQMIKRPVLQRLPENYISDSEGLDSLMVELEKSVGFGDITRVENAFNKLGVSHLVVRKDYDYDSPFRKVAVSVTPEQYRAVAERMGLKRVFSSPLVDVYEIKDRQAIASGVPVGVSGVSAEKVSLLPAGYEAVEYREGITDMLWVSDEPTERVPFDGILKTYSRGSGRWSLSADGGSIKSLDTLQINGVTLNMRPELLMPSETEALVINGEVYERTEYFSLPFGVKYKRVTQRGVERSIDFSEVPCVGVGDCVELVIADTALTAGSYLSLEFEGELQRACFRDLYGECSQGQVGDGWVRRMVDKDEAVTSLVLEGGSLLRNLKLDAMPATVQEDVWLGVGHDETGVPVKAGDYISNNAVSEASLDIMEFTDCAGNKDVNKGGVRKIKDGSLVISPSSTKTCSGIDVSDYYPGSVINLRVELDAGEVEACLFDHVADRCIASGAGSDVVALETGTRYYNEALTLYLYTGAGGSVVSDVVVSELSATGVYVSDVSSSPLAQSTEWNWDSNSGSVSVGQGNRRVVVLSEQSSDTWQARSVSDVESVVVNGYSEGWLVDGDVETLVQVKNSHSKTMAYAWAMSLMTLLLAAALRNNRKRR